MTFYTRPITITSQFSFCGLPLRLDSYGGCAFRCSFCFARYRGGNNGGDLVRPANPGTLRRVFEKALNSHAVRPGIIGQFLRRRVPIHFGGMSDPFQPAERRHGITRSFLQVLAQHRYPTVISTRGSMVASEPYLNLLTEIENVVVQFSFSSTRDHNARLVEPFSTPPSDLLRAMYKIARRGIKVTCRWQPFIQGVSEAPSEFLSRVASSGCRHVGLEHLKLPVERQNVLWPILIKGAGRDLHAEYKQLGAKRDGREYVLPAEIKLPKILEVRSLTRKNGMTFGAADNEFQFLSDTNCCCSGVDQFVGFENWFKYQIAYAVRKCRGKAITYSSISREWRPNGSIDRFVNGDSRLSLGTDLKGTITDHMRHRWNNNGSPGNPASFYGVRPTSNLTRNGETIYAWHDDVLNSDHSAPYKA
jgi:DNA repair photolyase